MSALEPSLDLSTIQTESINPLSTNIDQISTAELCAIINREDAGVPASVSRCIPAISRAVDAFTERVRHGGRVFYIGAGTSGRLGVLDASEIPPTYSAPASQFVGLIAGGDVALRNAVEGAEDDAEAAVFDLKGRELDGQLDCVIGIAASGRTPYVLGGLRYAKGLGCRTAGIACSAPSGMSDCGAVDFMINAVTGPEIVTGSTRMKAGTATKLVLNMISTGIMIRIGKTFGNVMVDVRPTNIKLQHRARRILRHVCGHKCPESNEALDQIIESCGRSVKLAAVAICSGLSVDNAKRRLEAAHGILADALEDEPSSTIRQRFGETQKHYLCVDAGGSKCAAFIQSSAISSRGVSGPCNLTEISVASAVAQIMRAVREAIDAHPDKQIIDEHGFSTAWVAIAGVDRADLKSNVHKALSDSLKLKSMDCLRVTNDVQLLVAIAPRCQKVSRAVVLVAGTGSVAILYEKQQDAFVQTDRSGGFGALLGDDGSGFDIGRRAIRFALKDLEHRARNEAVGKGPCELTRMVLEHYELAPSASPNELLSAVVKPRSDAVSTGSESRRMIAGCAERVLAIWSTCKEAQTIVENAIASLGELVSSLFRTPAVLQEEAVLILTGGLMKVPTFGDALQQLLKTKAIAFRDVIHLTSPAEIGVRHLAEGAFPQA